MKNFNKNNNNFFTKDNRFNSKNTCNQLILNFNHKCAKCSRKITTKLKAISTVFIIAYSCNTAFLEHQQAFAQAVAYRNAPNERHPIMDAAHNGVPVVHIAPPSSSGISHNQFEQFNVDKSGLVFNNSNKDIQSQLAGWIAGNPQLGHEPAKVILSEVMGSDPSLLFGPMEVAGRIADIIIANPNGITCDGCGFINTSRASLVVGKPEWSTTGLLDSFRVDSALLKIGEKGLNALQVAELDLIARTMQVGGEVWANKLNTILGTNRVFFKTLQTKPIDIGGGTPQFALDVKSVGGMFAKQIYLIATEYGIGVNSMGRLETLEGSLQLFANGDLKVDRVLSKDDLLIKVTGNADFLGKILAENRSIIEIGKNFEQKGYFDSKGIIEITATNFINTGTIVQRGKEYLQIESRQDFLNSGDIYSAGLLKLSANNLNSNKGLIYSENDIFVKSNKIDLVDSVFESEANINISSSEFISKKSDITTNKNLKLDSNVDFINNSSNFFANNSIDINSSNIKNDNVIISAKEHIKIESDNKIHNVASKIIAEEQLTVKGLGIDNTEGVLSANYSNLDFKSGDLINVKGNIIGDNLLYIEQGFINNEDGKIITKSNLNLDTKNSNLVNNRGLIKAENELNINSNSIYNTSGSIISQSDNIIKARYLDNNYGEIFGEKTSILLDEGKLNNAKGKIEGKSDLNLDIGEFSNKEGILLSDKNLKIDTKNQVFDNALGSIHTKGNFDLTSGEFQNNFGEIITSGKIDISSSLINNEKGKIIASNDLKLNTTSILNDNGEIEGKNVTLNLDKNGNLKNAAGKLISNEDLTYSGGNINNQKGLISSHGKLLLEAHDQNINNTEGLLVAQGVVTVRSGDFKNEKGVFGSGKSNLEFTSSSGLTNTDGTVFAKEDLQIDVGNKEILNVKGKIIAEGDLVLNASNLENNSGQISGVDIELNLTKGSNLSNKDGKVFASNNLILQGGVTSNNKGEIVAKGAFSLNTQGQNLVNNLGSIVAQGAVQIEAQALHNTAGAIGSTAAGVTISSLEVDNSVAGKIVAKKDFILNTNEQNINNNTGKILSEEGNVTVTTANIDSTQGEIGGGFVTLKLTEGSNLNNNEGKVIASKDLTLQGGVAGNEKGKIVAEGALSLNTQGQVLVNNLGSIVAQGAVQIEAQALHNTAGAIGSSAAGVTISSLEVDNSVTGKIVAKKDFILNTNEQNINNNTGKILSEEGNVTVNAANIDSTQGEIVGSDVTLNLLKGSNLSNNSGEVVARNNLTLLGGVAGNEKGKIVAEGALTLNSQGEAVNNISGEIIANSKLDLKSHALQNNAGTIGSGGSEIIIRSHAIDSTNGKIVAKNDITIDTKNHDITNNDKGKIGSKEGDIVVKAANFNNSSGEIAGKIVTLNLTEGSNLNNNEGKVVASKDLMLQGGLLGNEKGKIVAEGGLTLNSQGEAVNNNSGEIIANGKLDLKSHALQNNAGTIGSGGSDIIITSHAVDSTKGKIVAKKDISVNTNAQNIINIEGKILSEEGNVTVKAANIDSTQGEIVGSDVALNLLKGSYLSNNSGQVVARNNLILQGGVAGNNEGKIVAKGTLSLNTQGQELVNNLGSIVAQSAVQIEAQALHNTAGAIGSSAAGVTISSLEVDNSVAGKIVAKQDLILNTNAQNINNNTGKILSEEGNATVKAANIDSTQGEIVGGFVTLNLTEGSNLNNNEGKVSASKDLKLYGGVAGNEKGKIIAEGGLTLNSQGEAVNNNSGEIIANSKLDLKSHALKNNSGTIGSVDSDIIITSHLIDSTKGKIVAKKDISVNTNAQNIINIEGKILSEEGNVTVTAANIDSTQGEIVGSDVVLNLLKGSYLTNNSGKALARNNLTLQGGVADNEKGIVSAQGTLTLNSQEEAVNNNSGKIVAKSTLQLESHALQNNAGTIGSIESEITITSHEIDSTQGKIVAKKDISVSTNAQNIINIEGKILSEEGNVTVTAKNIDSTQGEIVGSDIVLNLLKGSYLTNNSGKALARNNLTLQGGVSGNEKGIVSAQGALTINSQQEIVNNNLGQIIANGNLILESHALKNSEGTIGSINNYLTITSHAINSTQGVIAAKNDITIDTKNHDIINDNKGKISSKEGSIVVTAANVNNSNGTITAANVNNSSSEGGSVTLNLSEGSNLNNNDGKVVASKNLKLDGGVKGNNNGEIMALGTLNINTQRQKLINQSGKIASGLSAKIISHEIDNSQGGKIFTSNPGANLEINSNNQQINNNKGKILASGNQIIKSGSIDNTEGEILGFTTQLHLQSGSLVNNKEGKIVADEKLELFAGVENNKLGLIASQQDMKIKTQGQNINNDNGTILSRKNLNITANNIFNNQTGKIFAEGNSDINSSYLYNKTGLLFSGGVFEVKSLQIDNTAGEIVAHNANASTPRSLNINTASQDILNVGGKIKTSGDLTITAKSVDNSSKGQIQGENVTFTASKFLNNNGEIFSKQTLKFTGTIADNIKGTIASLGDAEIVSQGLLNNNSGTLESHGKLKVTTGDLKNNSGSFAARNEIKINSGNIENISGKIFNHNDSVNIIAQNGDINNTGGLIYASAALGITGNSLNNNNGNLSGDTQNLNFASTLNNTSGKIIADNKLEIHSGELNNSAGVIAGKSYVTINLKRESLTNTSMGRIHAGTSLDITSGDVYNNNGIIYSGSYLKSDSYQIINKEGVIVVENGNSQNKLDINTNNNQFDNTQGTIISKVNAEIRSGNFDNANNGKVFASSLSLNSSNVHNNSGSFNVLGDATLQTQSFNNNSGTLFSGNNIKIDATGEVQNTSANIKALGFITLNANNLYNNSGNILALNNIEIESNNNFSNNSGKINSGSNLNIKSSSLDNNSGNLYAQNTINIESQNFSNDFGTVIADQDLILKTSSSNVAGKIISQGDSELEFKNDFINNAQISAKNTLTISANGVSNNKIIVGKKLEITSSNNFTNHAQAKVIADSVNIDAVIGIENYSKIDGKSVNLTGSRILNTSRISGDNLNLTAQRGSGEIENDAGGKIVGTSESGEVKLDAKEIRNVNNSQILSIGGLTFTASILENISTKIVAKKFINFDVDRVYNKPAVDPEKVKIEGKPENLPNSGMETVFTTGRRDGLTERKKGTLSRKTDTYSLKQHSNPSEILSGGDINFKNYIGNFYSTIAAAGTSRYSMDMDEGAKHDNLKKRPDVNLNENQNLAHNFNEYNKDTEIKIDNILKTEDEYYFGKKYHAKKLISVDKITDRVQIDDIYEWPKSIWDLFGNLFTDGSDLETKTNHYDQHKIGEIKPLAEATNISGAVVNTSSYFDNQNKIAVNPLTDSAHRPSLGSVETTQENYKKDVSRDGASFVEKRSIDSVSLPVLKNLQIATHQETLSQEQKGIHQLAIPTTEKPNFDIDNPESSSVNGVALSSLRDKNNSLLHPMDGVKLSDTKLPDNEKVNVDPVVIPQSKNNFEALNTKYSIQHDSLNPSVTLDKVDVPIAKGIDFTTINFNNHNSSSIDFYSRNALNPMDVNLSLSMPGSRYFDFRKSPGYRYLIENNPTYVEYNKFLSHDKYTEKLQLNPERQLKIYGDQFDSKRELGDQAVVLTGQQFLTNYQENEYKFQNLLNSGKMVAQNFQITPGTQLSDEQMATLTSDLIIDVNKDVDQVVVNVKNLLKTDLKSNGSLMIFGKVDLKISGDFNNTSSMYIGSGKIEAENIVNNPYASIFANSLTLQALNDIKNISGDIKGSGDNSSIILNAKRDIHIETKAMDEYFIVNGQKQKNTRVDRVATVSGDTVKLIAGRDINKIGANIYSKNETRQEAGRDINAKAAVTEKELLITNNKTSNFLGMIFHSSSQRIEENSVTHHVGKEISDGNSIIVAKNNVNYKGVEINDDQANVPEKERKFNPNQNVIIQGANVTITGVKDTKRTHDEYHFSKGEGVDKKYSETIVGGKVTAGNSIIINAFERENNTDSNSKSGNILLQGSAITAVHGDAKFYADNKIDVLSESLKSSSYSYNKSTNDGIFSSKTTTTQGESERDGVYGSKIGGNSVILQAGKGGEKKGDILVSGSQIASDQKTVLKAGNNVSIEAATEQTYASFHESTRTTGIFASEGRFGFTIGKQEKDKGNKTKENLIASSEVGSRFGTLVIDAGNTFSQTGGSKLSALGDVGIFAEKVKTEAGISTVLEENSASQKTSGLSFGASNPVVGAAQGVVRTAENMNKVEDDRFKGLALLSNSLAAKNAVDALQKSPKDLGGVKVKYTIGQSKSGQSSVTESTLVHKSGIYTQGNLIVQARGAGKESSIDLSGSDLKAEGKIRLEAEGNILMQAAQKTTERRSSQWNSGWELGIGANAGKSTGFTIEAGVSGGEGWSKSSEIQHVDTIVEGKQGVEVVSGGDTTLKGAQVKGKFIKADIAGNLHIESLQDSKTHDSEEYSFGVSASACIPPACVGAQEASVNGSVTDMASNYKSVITQSGFLAGSGGYQVDVGGHTQLVGGMIASNQEAKDKKLNKFSTETLDFVDLKNEAEYDVKHIGGGFSVGDKLSVSPPQYLPGSKKISSVTRSVIDEGVLEIRNDKKQLALTGKTAEEIQTSLHRDSRTAHQKADEIFDEEQIRLKIGIVNDFGKEFGTFISNRGQEAEQKEKELEHALKNSDTVPPEYIEQLKQEYESAAKWAPGGEYRQVATALAAAFTGKLSATGTELVQSFAANYLQSIGAEKIKELAPLLGGEGSPGHTAMHAVLGCAAGAMGDSCGSRAFGAASGVLINTALSSLEDTQNLSAAERENRINIVTSLVAGMSAAAGLGDPNAAMTSARLETENNALFLIPIAITGLAILDKVYTGYELYKDIEDVCNGKKTWEQLVQEKGIDYVSSLVVTKVGTTTWKGVKKLPGVDEVLENGKNYLGKMQKKIEDAIRQARKKEIDVNDPDYKPTLGGKGPIDSLKSKKEFEAMYGKENVISHTVPDLDKPNVNMAGRAINVELNDGRVVKVVYDQKGLPGFTPHMKTEVIFSQKTMLETNYEEHLTMSTKALWAEVQKDPVLKRKFTEAELLDMEQGKQKIGKYTWHHHQDLGRMQLVETKIHKDAPHVGAKSLNPELKERKKKEKKEKKE
ncbi:hemagglutinin repeat-containing protein [Spirobacillus cienkowskii]|uniref:hemagglutinin repeat-containing protein n=1 Tax=Spirobacillus cienkowskii TaxID=495820 RepID=UPI0030D36B71